LFFNLDNREAEHLFLESFCLVFCDGGMILLTQTAESSIIKKQLKTHLFREQLTTSV